MTMVKVFLYGRRQRQQLRRRGYDFRQSEPKTPYIKG